MVVVLAGGGVGGGGGKYCLFRYVPHGIWYENFDVVILLLHTRRLTPASHAIGNLR